MAQQTEPDDITRYSPRSGRLIREDGYYINEAEIALREDSSFSVFNEVRSVIRNPIISLNSMYPLSILRDFVSRGTVSHNTDRYFVKPTSTLESAEIGRYVSGYSAEAGVGILFDPSVITDVNWGYFNDSNGFFFRWNGTDYSVVVRKDGSDSIIPRSDWNQDKLDGSGLSGIDLDLSDGFVFQIEYTWYGYGPIIFSIVSKQQSNGNKPRLYPIHIETIKKDTTTTNPNLPIRVENNSTSGDVSVTGRQFSIIGGFKPEQRLTFFVNPTPVTVDNDWTVVQSYQRIPGKDNISISADLVGLVNEGTELVEYQLLVGTTLTGSFFGLPENRSTNETAVQYDTSATAFTGGEQIAGDVASGQSRNNSSETIRERPVDIRIPRDYVVSLVARTLNTGTTSNVRGVTKVIEEF